MVFPAGPTEDWKQQQRKSQERREAKPGEHGYDCHDGEYRLVVVLPVREMPMIYEYDG